MVNVFYQFEREISIINVSGKQVVFDQMTTIWPFIFKKKILKNCYVYVYVKMINYLTICHTET